MTLECAPGMIAPTDGLGWLVINGVNMHTNAWNLPDIRELYLPNTFRGQNLIIPSADGRRAYPLRIDESDYLLPMQITGVCDQSGNLFPNEYIGLETNLAYLEFHVFGPPGAPTATKPAALHMPSGELRAADVQIGPLRFGRKSGSITLGILDIRIPSGGFVKV